MELDEWHFEQTWRAAARKGYCDSFGGAEYRRVKAAWIEAGKPQDHLVDFIRTCANEPPDYSLWDLLDSKDKK